MKGISRSRLLLALLTLTIGLVWLSNGKATAALLRGQDYEIVTGYFAIIHGDPMPLSNEESRDQTVYSVTDTTGETTWLTFSERLRKLFKGFDRFNGKKVKVWLKRERTARAPARPALQSGAAIQVLAAPEAAASTNAITGSKPWISVLCKFPDISNEPKDLDYFESMFDNTTGRLDHFWREVSYGNINVVGSTAIDWVTLPHPQSYYIPKPGTGCFSSNASDRANLSQLFADCTAAANPFVDFSNGGQPFEGINLMFNSDLDGCAWGGSIWGSLDGVSKVWRTTWEPPWGYGNVAVMAHEMGHGFGLPHSNNWDQDSDPYDNPWDVMSDTWDYVATDPVYGVIGKHTISYHKDKLGWIKPEERFDLPGDGTYTITIDELELASVQDYRMAVIPIPDSSRFYTVEVRARVAPYDSHLPAKAVIIHQVDPSRREPAWLVDAASPPSNYGDGPGVMWTVGESFEDAADQISVTVDQETAQGFEVSITSGNTQAPVASFTAMPTSGDAPLLVQFSNQSTGTTSSWLWDFGDGSTSSAEQPSHIYNDPGDYTVTLTVTGPTGTDTSTKQSYISVTEAGTHMESGAPQFDNAWATVNFRQSFSTPVVIVGPPTFHGGQPGVIRLRNVGSNGFEMRFQEWLYLDGSHVTENAPYLALEAGRVQMDDGSIWEAGIINLDGTGKWISTSFSQSFPAPPKLFLTMQTYAGGDTVTVRARNVTEHGFDAALFEEEAKMDGHVVEQVGYLAVYSPALSGVVAVNDAGTPYLLQTATANQVFSPVLSSSIKVEEEQSRDSETGHVDETLAVLALGNHLFAQDVSFAGGDTAALRRLAPEDDSPVEWGTVDGVDHDWVTVPLVKNFTHPVVVAKPVSYNGGDPGVVRVRNVSGKSFQLRYQEWLSKDGWHVGERMFYMVAEAGSHTLGNLQVEAGSLASSKRLNDGWESAAFASPFTAPPAVFASIQTENGTDPVLVRSGNVTTGGFDLVMEEEEGNQDSLESETLGWIAIQKGATTTSDNRPVKVMDAWADNSASENSFGQTFNHRFPIIVGNVSTTNETDPCTLRYLNLTQSGVELLLQEETSADPEIDHLIEGLSLFVSQ